MKQDYREEKTVKFSTFVVSIAVVLCVGFIAGTRKNEIFAMVSPIFGAKFNSGKINLDKVQEVYSELKANFDGNLDDEKLIDGAAKGLVAAAEDKHTEYYTEKEKEEFNKSLNGDVGAGIGVEIESKNNLPRVVRVLKNNSAYEAGIQQGDYILEVNGESMTGKTVQEASSKIRGEAGTTVKLKIGKDSDKSVKEISLTRKRIENPSVELNIDGDIAVMKIHRFDSNTGSLAKKYAQEIKDRGVEKIILDLRENGGGYVTAAEDVASLWLDKGEIIISEKGLNISQKYYKAKGGNILKGKKTIVLVNENSASASEIVAGALRESGAAKIYGTKSFGKGSVQQAMDLASGGMIKMTIAKWYLKSGKNIDKEGISPDKEVKNSKEDEEALRDNQLEETKKDLK